MVDGIAVFLFGGLERPLARLDIKLRDHQAAFVNRRDDRVADQLHPPTLKIAADMIEDDLLQRDMENVEFRRLGPRQHSFLTMTPQINVGAQIGRVAQMGDETDQRIGHPGGPSALAASDRPSMLTHHFSTICSKSCSIMQAASARAAILTAPPS